MATTGEPSMTELFRRCGFPEREAAANARLVESGEWTFDELILSELAFPNPRWRPDMSEARKISATFSKKEDPVSEREKSVQESTENENTVSEADLDALGDAAFGQITKEA